MQKVVIKITAVFLIFLSAGMGLADTEQKIGTDNEDMVFVPAGEFFMGSTDYEVKKAYKLCKKYNRHCYKQGFSDEMPRHKVYLDDFYMDKYEVTITQYLKCVEKGGCTTNKSLARNTKEKGNYPVAVTWFQADMYCKWVGKRLPTEAEWEKTARGGDLRIFPWGDEIPSCEYAVMWDQKLGSGCGRDSAWPVGSKPKGASPYGAMDMAGNIHEWVADWYSKYYYEESPYKNPSGPCERKEKVMRGGGCGNTPVSLRVSSRHHLSPDEKAGGFRCAKSP